ncbi:Predicted ATP-dependent endonuclease of the OLD family, contains P-loop ATPase and TOPRIM domains [Caloranaerobacter azorensis DSM 13643]|uniref:Predicted ATP-dependent endonuclease of the OLD family, contains P-loop ATPase and TOPRIM domains n=1 Tax=Caloranaerobacter azorensis DSM 13643 TaxID=1121264 RepID=A0A1M5VPQ4_9FIRM|nr:AAA family ATPase [Caloranaerobacter azorensis]SHH76903.1 Predicted ATP-dependent endonuclease of the OLD family, contains P-loop ATPase and TOPRIM domains [Caloranaerobacter azorensis DSM 13643]
MFVSKLYIKNFRSIEKLKISFRPGKNVLVGKNNAGKSNIVKALNLILGEKSPIYSRKISEKDFFSYLKDGEEVSKKAFFVAVKLEGKDINKTIFEKINGLRLATLEGTNLLESFFENSDRTNCELLMNNFQGKYYRDTEQLFNMFSNADELYIYFCAVKDHERKYDMDCYQDGYSMTYSILFKYNSNYYRCSKFPNDLRDSLITSAILPAVRNISNELKVNSWSWYGKLIKHIWEQSDFVKKREINTKLSEIKKITDSIFNDAISDIQEKIKKAIYHNNISFQLLENTKDDIYKGIEIFVDDGVLGLLKDKGTGIQSALIISLFSYYCSKFHKNSSLLAVEEPEIYLHPQARRVLSNKFDEFINLNHVNGNQVIITTHSSEFIRNTNLENIIVVRKIDGRTITKSITFHSEKNKDLIKIQNIISTKNAEIFFADKVILVEGGEEYIIPLIADKHFGEIGFLDNNNITVAKVGGKYFFRPYLQLISALGIEYYVIADFDILYDGLEHLKEFIDCVTELEINEIKSELFKIVSPDNPWKRSKKIKEELKKYDAKEFCNLIENMCNNGEYNEQLRELWNNIKPKFKKKVDYETLQQHENLQKKVYNFINKLKENNIYILKKGELEDYITSCGWKVIKESGFTDQKELRIMKLTEKISTGDIELEDVLDVKEYLEVIQKIKNTVE